MICLWEIIENVGKTNNFHDFRETSKAGAIVLRVMEIVGNVGKTNIYHCGPPPSGTQVLVFMLLNRRADLGTGGGVPYIYIYIY